MIRTIKIDLSAANPQLPLQPVSVFEGSAATLVLLNVPRSLGKRTITAVSVVVINPDSMAQAYEATREGSAYQVTIPAEAFGGSGSVENGIMISASGVNERGEMVDQWILGSGDLVVMAHDGTVKPGERRTVVHYFDEAPASPSKGDIANIDGALSIFDGSEWQPLGGGSSGGAIVLTTNGSKIFKNGVELTSYTSLLRLVQAGGVTLMGTVGADKDALYYPLFCDTNAIRFDATGTLGGDVKTKSYTVQPVNGDSIRVGEGSLIDLAKKSDIPTSMPWGNVTNKPSVFPPELVSQLDTEPTEEDAGKAASAKQVFDKLKEKFDKTGGTVTGNMSAEGYFTAKNGFMAAGSAIFQMVERLSFEPSGSINIPIDCGDVALPNKNGILALVSQLSGITSQDITDFLKYKGEYDISKKSSYVIGDVIFHEHGSISPTDGITGFYRGYVAVEVCIPGDAGWEFIYAKNYGKTGLERLIDLFGESNSQLKATIEANAVIFLRYSSDFIYKGEVKEENKITKFSDLAKIVQTGRAVLQATATSASGSSPVLFRPHMINDGTVAQAANILFDATGTIGEGVYTRCIRAAIKAGTDDELMVQGDNQREQLAKEYVVSGDTDDAKNRSIKVYNADSLPSPIPLPNFPTSGVIDLEVWIVAGDTAPTGVTFGKTIYPKGGEALTFEANSTTIVHLTAVAGQNYYTAVAASFKAEA